MREIDHEYTNEIVCPWCGYEFSDSWELGNGGECTELEECPDCEKEFYASRIITVEYSTQKATYGTCSKCGAEDVVVESQKSSFNSYCDFCSDCIKESEKQAREEYLKKIIEHKSERTKNVLNKCLGIKD
mgnify:CR=1 FL=1